MRLHTSQRKHKIYKSLQSNLHDLVIGLDINWELEWSQIPVQDKANLFEVARNRYPILTRYHNDWATEKFVKMYCKNKRKNAYRNDRLEVPTKYAYLANNAMKRAPGNRRRAVQLAELVQKASIAKKASARKRMVRGWRRTVSKSLSLTGENERQGPHRNSGLAIAGISQTVSLVSTVL
ncbi:hypothetical protein LshimejAT787_5900010 [Lyophyllum shimeji]|uniref:Uncharacterized protein n=1 Tax=Lyophyllum shimeji TaxID=47721 RepID=A0A9P3Q2S5_LYOSH|nr:hypothetical protein LshimejAT787_5900010 [Lyophyllum shimeji]